MKRLALFAGLAAAGLTGAALLSAGRSAAQTVVPAPKLDEQRTGGSRTALLAGGCFWGTEAVFEHVRGVQDVVSGFAGAPGAEVVRITYDPRQVTYGQLLRIFFSVAHDPTQVGGQGPDRGPGYRSAIFAQTGEQRRIAAAYLAQLSAAKAYPRPLTTRLETGRFAAAPAAHQDFMRRNPAHPYVVVHDRPKLAQLKARYPALWRA